MRPAEKLVIYIIQYLVICLSNDEN